MAKTAAAKRLVEEKDISVQEAERWLDVDVHFTEHQCWIPSGFTMSSCCNGMEDSPREPQCWILPPENH